MKQLIATKSIAALAIALGAIAAVSSAHARSDVQFSIGLQVPGVYVQSVPMYVQPREVYTPVPIYLQPRPVYMPVPIEYGHFDDRRRYREHHWQGYNQYRDLDRDGIVNRYDRDRDGDGVPNRYDRQPDNPYRR